MRDPRVQTIHINILGKVIGTPKKKEDLVFVNAGLVLQVDTEMKDEDLIDWIQGVIEVGSGE